MYVKKQFKRDIELLKSNTTPFDMKAVNLL